MNITKKTKEPKNREKKGKRISRTIHERLHTSTKVEVREYHELWYTCTQMRMCSYTLIHITPYTP